MQTQTSTIQHINAQVIIVLTSVQPHALRRFLACHVHLSQTISIVCLWQWQLAEARAGRLGLAQRLAKWHQSSVSWCRPSAGVEARQQRLALARGGSVVLAHSTAQVLLGAR